MQNSGLATATGPIQDHSHATALILLKLIAKHLHALSIEACKKGQP